MRTIGIRPTHCPSIPMQKLRGDAWGCMGMHEDGPSTKFGLPSPQKGLIIPMQSPHIPMHPHTIPIFSHLFLSIYIYLYNPPTQNFAMVPILMENLEVSTCPHAKVRDLLWVNETGVYG